VQTEYLCLNVGISKQVLLSASHPCSLQALTLAFGPVDDALLESICNNLQGLKELDLNVSAVSWAAALLDRLKNLKVLSLTGLQYVSTRTIVYWVFNAIRSRKTVLLTHEKRCNVRTARYFS